MNLRTHRDQFADRVDAGRSLAVLLTRFAGRADVVVLGLPRGGVPVAAEVAHDLRAELDVMVVRKLGVPTHPELAMGAIADVGSITEVVCNDTVVSKLAIRQADFDAVYRTELAELRRRSAAYRGNQAAVPIAGRVVIIVDDGLATGSTMRAAIAAVRRQGPGELIVAVPVGGLDTCRELAADVDEVVCALTPAPFHAVRQGYLDFTQTTDAQVLAVLARVSR